MNKLFNFLDYKGESLKVVEKHKIWFSIPIAIFTIAIIVFIVFAILGGSFSSGLNLGIDFTGGTIITVNLGEEAQGDNYETNARLIEDIIVSKDMQIAYTQQSGTGDESEIVIRYRGDMSEAEIATLNEEIQAEIQELFPEIYSEYQDIEAQFIELEYIGATTSIDLVGKAILSIVVAAIAILIYIVIRFEVYSGITAIIALLHDVFMIFAFVIITRVQLNSEFIAVIITVISYSINNTIVVFDRVRENISITPINNKMSYSSVLNKSVSETLSRSINTTITTLLTITVLAILSVPIIRDFSLMIIVGLLSGTFSSLCIAPSLYSLLREKMNKKQNETKFQSSKQASIKQKNNKQANKSKA